MDASLIGTNFLRVGEVPLCCLLHTVDISFRQASTYQMALLLQFNTATEHTVSHLQACTQLKEVHSLYITWYIPYNP